MHLRKVFWCKDLQSLQLRRIGCFRGLGGLSSGGTLQRLTRNIFPILTADLRWSPVGKVQLGGGSWFVGAILGLSLWVSRFGASHGSWQRLLGEPGLGPKRLNITSE